MSLVDHIRYDDNVSTVNKTRFGVLSPEKIIETSVAHIYKPLGKKGTSDAGTLNDPRLGAVRGRPNAVTGLSIKFDPGNFGHTILAKPVYHPMFFSYVKQTLGCICLACSALRFKTSDDKKANIGQVKMMSNQARFLRLVELLSKNQTECARCRQKLPQIRENKSPDVIIGLQAIFKHKDPETKKTIQEIRNLTPEQVWLALKQMSDEDCEIIGLDPKRSRPDWMIATVLPIPPPVIRPSVQVDNGKTSLDDLTYCFNNIIRWNNALIQQLEKAPAETSETDERITNRLWHTLQHSVATMVDNETSSYMSATNRQNRPLKTIRKRHRGKQGRIRWNLMGKRVNASARTVITADPNISINQVGVPQKIAMTLTYPEIVTKYNRSHLARLVENGPSVYPGAKHFRDKNSKFRIDLAVDRKIYLKEGDIVYRHMLDGDIVFFNRQPSLHKMSMMAHRAIILPGNSFRLNVNVTPPYNADFDGDEMNLHLPQSVQTVNELAQLAMVSTQIVSPQASKPVIGLVQDSLLGMYRMSSEKVRGFAKGERYFMNPRQFMRLVAWLNNYSGLMPKPLKGDGASTSNLGWTTRQLFSMFFPDITLQRAGTIIENGILAEPKDGEDATPIGKQLVGKSAGGGLFHISWNDLGPSVTRDLLDNISRLTSQWLLDDGFSVGLSDLDVSDLILAQIEQVKLKYLNDAQELIEGLHLGNYDDVRDRIIREPRGLFKNDFDQFESDMMYHLGDCKEKITELSMNGLGAIKDNRINSMVSSGSKGSKANVVQIVGMLGQQDIAGARISSGLMERPFPHVAKGDLSPETRGFIRNSFIDGLSPIPYICHAMAGRIGMISTSIKTADTGYIQRKLVKVLEDVFICYDGTVRNANGVIVQYVYGGDGFDASRIEPQHLDYLGMADDHFMLKYQWSESDLTDLELVLTDEANKHFKAHQEADKLEDRAVTTEFEKVQADREEAKRLFRWEVPEKLWAPVNFTRLIEHIKSKLGLRASTRCDMTPMEIIDRVNDLIETLHVTDNVLVNHEATKIFRFLLRSQLNAKSLIFKHHFNQEALDYLLTSIKVKFNDSLISPGEAVGPIAAQSIGEPATQMTLDTFHHTGIGAKANVSRGVPRLKELLSISTNTKTPSIVVYLEPNFFKHMKVDELDMTIQSIDEQLQTESEETVKDHKVDLQTGIIRQVKKLKAEFDYISFGDLVNKFEIIYDPRDSDTLIPEDQEMLNAFWELCDLDDPDATNSSPWVLRFELNGHKLADHNIQTYQLEYILNKSADIKSKLQCIFSDDNQNSQTVVCRARITNLDANPANIGEELRELMFKTKIKGISGIKQTSIRIEKTELRHENGAIISPYHDRYSKLAPHTVFSEQYVIDTSGSNLLDILNMPFVDANKTYTNAIHEIYDVYGIEGARQAIINEIMEVLDYAGASISSRHVELLADVMTSRGIMQSVDRFGIKKGETGVWARASFEETTPNMISAAVFSEDDNMRGVSASCMFGQFVKVGTNSFEVGVDEEMLSRIAEDDEDEFEITHVTKESAEYCKPSSFEFNTAF